MHKWSFIVNKPIKSLFRVDGTRRLRVLSNIALRRHVVESFIELLGVNNSIVVRSLFIIVLDILVRANGERALIELFLCYVLEGERRYGCIRVLLSVCEVGNKMGDILLDFREVLSHIILVELTIVVVSHRSGNLELEVGLVEGVRHALGEVLNDVHLGLYLKDLLLLLIHRLLHLVNFSSSLFLEFDLLALLHGAQLLVSLDLCLDVVVLVTNYIDFGGQHTHIVHERAVLLLSLYESRNDFLSGADASSLLDLIKGVDEDLYVPCVHVNQVLLLLVVLDPPVESELEQLGGIRKLCDGLLLHHGLASCSGELLVVVRLLQLLLQHRNLGLKVFLISFLLGLDGDDFVVLV